MGVGLHQCHADGCDTQARFSTQLHLTWPDPRGTRELSIKCSIAVCHRHRDKVGDYVFSDINKQTMIKDLTDAGYPVPIFENARLEFIPIAIDQTVILKPVAMCDCAGCIKPAKVQIKQIFPHRERFVEALTNLCVCEEHRDAIKPADLFNDGGMRATRKFLARRGIKHIDFGGVKLGFVPLTLGQRIDPETFGEQKAPEMTH